MLGVSARGPSNRRREVLLNARGFLNLASTTSTGMQLKTRYVTSYSYRQPFFRKLSRPFPYSPGARLADSGLCPFFRDEEDAVLP